MDVPGMGVVRFVHPEWLLALWGLLLLIPLYLLRRRAVRVFVPHLPIWERVLARRRRRPGWQRALISLLLQCLIFAAAILLVAGPVTDRDQPGRGHTVIVLDRSLGTRARDVDDVPVAAAVVARGEELAERAVVAGPVALAFLQDGLIPLLAGTEDLTRIREALDDPGSPRGGRDFLAVSELRPVLGPDVRIVCVTPFAADPETTAALGRAGVLVVPAGRARPNAGIVAVERVGDGLRVRVSGGGGVRSLALRRDHRVLFQRTVNPVADGADVSVPLPADAGPAPDLVLGPGDGFPDDDRVPLAFPERERLSLLVVADTPTPFLDAFLEASSVVDVSASHRVRSNAFREWVDDYDVVVLVDDQQELPLPPGRYLLLGSGAPELPVVRDPQSESASEPVEVHQEDPLVRALDLARWKITAVAKTRARSGLEVIVGGSTGPLVSRARTQSHQIVDIAVRPDPTVSTLPLMATFPLLLEAALIELSGHQEAGAPPVLPAGGVLQLARNEEPVLRVRGGGGLPRLRQLPDGTGFRLPERPGHYEVGSGQGSRTIAVGLLEHPGRPGAPLEGSAPQLPPFPESHERVSWRWLLLFVLGGALLLEWSLWHLRITE